MDNDPSACTLHCILQSGEDESIFVIDKSGTLLINDKIGAKDRLIEIQLGDQLCLDSDRPTRRYVIDREFTMWVLCVLMTQPDAELRL